MRTGTLRKVVGFARDPVAVVNWRFSRAAGGDERPAFYDIDKTYPAFRLLDRSYPTIREEMESVLNYRERIPRYHDLDRAETYISGSKDPAKNWRVFMLWSAAGRPAANQARCPRTTALLRKVPGLYQALPGGGAEHSLRRQLEPRGLQYERRSPGRADRRCAAADAALAARDELDHHPAVDAAQ